MSKVNSFNTFFAMLFLLVSLYSEYILYGTISTLLSDSNSFGEGIGNILGYIILLVFWLLSQLLCLLLLLLSKLWKQKKFILILSSINLVIYLGAIGLPAYEANVLFDINFLQSLGIVFLPFVIYLITLIKGFKNL